MYFFLFFFNKHVCTFTPNKNRKTNLYSTFHRNGITKKRINRKRKRLRKRCKRNCNCKRLPKLACHNI